MPSPINPDDKLHDLSSETGSPLFAEYCRKLGSIVVSYALDDDTDPLTCFDTDMLVKHVLDEIGCDHFTIYSHHLVHGWFSVKTNDPSTLAERFLREARGNGCLAGVDVEIDGQWFVV